MDLDPEIPVELDDERISRMTTRGTYSCYRYRHRHHNLNPPLDRDTVVQMRLVLMSR